MRLATWNIYFLGDDDKVERNEQDLDHIARVVARLRADVLAFQEIMRGTALRDVLDRVNELTGRRYETQYEDGSWIASGSFGMRVMMAYDAATIDLRRGAAINGGVGRRPCALQVREKASGHELTAIGVHLQSGHPSFDEEGDASTRFEQCKHLARWIEGELKSSNPRFPELATAAAVILGDFNALYDTDTSEATLSIEHPQVSYNSLAPLRSGALSTWYWPKPRSDVEGERFSVYGERLMIDFIMVSMKELVVEEPTLHSFDHDSEIGASGVRVSDHRPVVVEVTLEQSSSSVR